MSQNLIQNEALASRMPILFVGHGSPMNAIEKNPYTQMLASLA